MSERYHINAKGDVSKCGADGRACRFGDDDVHFDTAEAARREFESWMEHMTVPPPIHKRVERAAAGASVNTTTPVATGVPSIRDSLPLIDEPPVALPPLESFDDMLKDILS